VTEFCASAKLLKTELGSTTIGSTKFWQLSKTETPGLPNTLPLGNSLHFPMVHFMTPNGQQLMSYGYQNMAGLLTGGNLNRLNLSEQIRILAKFHHDHPRNFVYELMNSASRRLLIQPIPIHGFITTTFWSQVTVLNYFG
jgi:hypothetical protein